jgi:transposase
MKPDSYDGAALITFLKDLKKHSRWRYVVPIWDGLPAHRRREMQEFLVAQQDWLYVARLPGYAPDLNPVADLWENLKGHELANPSADNRRSVTSTSGRPVRSFHFIELAGPPRGAGMKIEAVEFLRDSGMEFSREGLRWDAHKFGWLGRRMAGETGGCGLLQRRDSPVGRTRG